MDRDLAGADLLRLLRHQQLTSLHRPAADDPATAEHRDHGPGDRGRISARRGAADRPEHPAQLGRCVWHDAGKELPSRAGFRQRALWGDAGSDLHSESDAGLPEHRSKLPDADAHGEGRLRSPVGVWRATLRTDQDTMMKRILLVTIGLIFSLGAQAQTSCSLLSQCPNALLPLNGSEIMYIVQGGISRQVTTSNFMGVSTSILPLNNVWTGSNTFSNNINTNTIVNVGSFSSSITTTGTAIGAVLDNQFNCTDTQTVTGANTGKICLFVRQSYGGSGVSGVRQAIEAYGLLTSPTSPTNPDRFYTASTSTEEAQTGDGGFDTTTNASGLLGDTSISLTSTTGVTTGRLISIQLATVV